MFDCSHIPGSPDLELHIPREGMIWILLAECKKPEGGVHSTKQKEYRDKYLPFKNVVYKLIKSRSDLENAVEEITGYYQKSLDQAFSIFDKNVS